MDVNSASEINFNSIRLWLERAQANASKCFVCQRIAQENEKEGGEIKPIKISGIELTPEVQIGHLARCVGRSLSP
jgi:hypothetical protein